MSAEDSDDSDEWGREELTLPVPKASAIKEEGKEQGEDYWAPEPTKVEPEKKTTAAVPAKPIEPKDDRPMIIVDMTKMSKDVIHSKFDRSSVNDAQAASTVRKKIEQDYAKYANDAALLADGTVIPCGQSVYRDALSRLRDERAGHFFSPIFPPK